MSVASLMRHGPWPLSRRKADAGRQDGRPPRAAGQIRRREAASGPLFEGYVVAPPWSQVDLARPGDLLLLVQEHLFPLGEPARGARYREEDGEHVHRESHGLVDQARVEVDIGIQLPLDEVLVLESDALELEGDVEERVAPGHLEHAIG